MISLVGKMWANMGRRGLVLLVVGIILVLAVFPFLLPPVRISGTVYGHYERKIERNAKNEFEVQALRTVENFNYSSIFGLSRFEEVGDVWANFIDLLVIEYYNDTYNSLQQRRASHNVSFHYTANVSSYDRINVILDRNDRLFVVDENDSLLLEAPEFAGVDWGMKFAHWSGSGYEILDGPFSLNFSNSCVLEMSLRFDDVFGNLGAYYVWVYQLIVVDENLEPVLLCVQPSSHIVA